MPALAAAEQQLAGYQAPRPSCCAPCSPAGGSRSATRGWPVWVKLIISESRNFPDVAQYYHDHVILRGRSLLRSALQRGIASGEFRAWMSNRASTSSSRPADARGMALLRSVSAATTSTHRAISMFHFSI